MMQKEEFYILHADTCKAFFNAKRLAIIDALRGGSMNVSGLSCKLDTSQSNISQHLGILKSKGLVSSNIKGNCTYYQISSQKIFMAFDIVNAIVKEKFKDDSRKLRKLTE